MNILIDKLPTDYEGLKINTNFRSFILFELLMQENLKEDYKMAMALKLFYEEPIQDVKKAIEGILWFYSRGKKEQKSEKTDNTSYNNIYSYEHDADLIYSAFLSQYGIDLATIDYLHWFEFRALFEGLNDENRICQIMGYRSINLNEIKDKKEREKYKKLKRRYALPDNRSVEEKERDFANALW